MYAENGGVNNVRSSFLAEVSEDSNFVNHYPYEYAIAKAKMENLLKKPSKKNWTIIRPYITFNDNRLQLGTLEKEMWLM